MNNNLYNSTEERETEEGIPVSTRNRRPRRLLSEKKSPADRNNGFARKWLTLAVFAAVIAAICAAFFVLGFKVGRKYEQKSMASVLNSSSSSSSSSDEEEDTDPGWNAPDYVEYQPIVKNEYSRPDIKLEEINAVVVHYVADPTATAAQTRAYFNNLAITHYTWASSHFVVGLDGEVLQLIPLTEWAYCSNERNKDTVSIECCHPEEDGKFTDATYDSLVKLVADLCREYKLDPLKDVIRHYDVTGKLCPLYFVEHEDAWHEFLTDVAAAVTASGN